MTPAIRLAIDSRIRGREDVAVHGAFMGQHFDFGVFVRDLPGRLTAKDERLRAVGCIEGALKLQRLSAALLARIFIEGGIEHFWLRINLVGDARRQHGDDHRHSRLHADADLLVAIGRIAAVNLQKRSELVFFLDSAIPDYGSREMMIYGGAS